MDTEEEYFSFTVKTDFSNSHTRFDQCGVVVYQDSENWIKGSIEYENEDFQHLGSVVTNHGFSDWATQEIPASVKSIYYRLSRRAAISASKTPKTVSILSRCGSATCMKAGKFILESMPVHQKTLL